MKTIAQQLNVTTFPFDVKDKNNKEIYFENSDGWWCKKERDARGKIIRYEASDGAWCKREYDAHSNEIYYENSNGYIKDDRPKIVELTLQQIADKFSIDVKQLKIKDE